MSDVTHLADRRADRSRASTGPVAFFYSLDCPVAYIAAERVERALDEVAWIPVVGPLSESSGLRSHDERLRLARERAALAKREARTLDVPLVEPHRFPLDSRRAARAAIWAAGEGRGARFALGVARAAFCGGLDISSDEVIGDAAAGAGLDPMQAVQASRDPLRDYQLYATAKGLQGRGILMPPVIRIGASWFCGSDAMTAAVSLGAGEALEHSSLLPVS